MVLVFNWVDGIIIGIIILFALGAFRRFLIYEILDLISFLLGFFLAFRFYNPVSKLFEIQFIVPHRLSLAISFTAVWFLIEAIFFLLIWLVLPKIPKIKFFQLKIVSVIPAIIRSLVLIAIILVLTATFPIQPLINKAVLDSKIGSQILKHTYNLESLVKSALGGEVNDTLTFLTVGLNGNTSINLGFQISPVSIDEEAENTMLSLVNKERTDKGLNVLMLDNKLTETARVHSKDMFEKGYFSHNVPNGKTVSDRALASGADFLSIGENLAYSPSLEIAHVGLMNSKSHRENILSTGYRRIGIGIMDGGVYGKMFTQVFAN